MSEKITMPKNVQSFLYKYGSLGSKEQDSAFWKEFRKAANAYADVQSKRICDLEQALAEERKHYKKIEDKLRADLRGHPDSELWGESGLIAATMRCVDAVDTLTEQRDRLAEALKNLMSACEKDFCSIDTEQGNMKCNDDESVLSGGGGNNSNLTFGLIRQAQMALATVKGGSDEP